MMDDITAIEILIKELDNMESEYLSDKGLTDDGYDRWVQDDGYCYAISIAKEALERELKSYEKSKKINKK